MTAKVLPFRSETVIGQAIETYADRRFEPSSGASVQTIRTELPESGSAIDMADLYPDPTVSAGLRSAISQLEKTDRLLLEALARLGEDEVIAADDAVQRAQDKLAELFCFRWLGDGFGQIIGALNISLSNQEGMPLTAEQIGALRARIRRLQDEPFMSDDLAASEVQQLDAAGLRPFANELFDFAELGDDDGIR